MTVAHASAAMVGINAIVRQMLSAMASWLGRDGRLGLG
jgi:hypothetical protein